MASDVTAQQKVVPFTRFLLFWVPLIILITATEAVAVPLRIVLGLHSLPAFAGIDTTIMGVFLIDFLINLGREHGERSRMGWVLTVADATAALPLHLIFGFFPLVFLRLAKLIRVAHWMSVWRHQHLQRWNVLRLVYFVCWLGLFVHWLATGWLALRGVPPMGDPWTAYLQSLYWCISTLTTIGYATFTPSNNGEILYAIAVMIFGVGMYGYVIANVATILTNLEPARVRYLENLERIGAFMRYRRIPSHLRKRIREYYSYLWDQRLGYDEGPIVDALPPGLRTEVALHLKREIIQKVPFFRRADEGLLRDIALQMHPVVYTPGDFVFREGDPGQEMYFICSGRLRVLAEKGRTVLASLGEGDFFGEMALLLQQPRTASVQADSYCDLYRLDKSSFVEVVGKHPEFAEHVQTMTEARRKRKR
jgi:hypothetical protein